MGLPELYPMVSKILDPKALGLEPFRVKPIGVTVHHAADRDADRVFAWLKQKRLGYHILIDRDGGVIQTTYFNLRVDHAGKASWLGYMPNRVHIAIALLTWGNVNKVGEKYFAWNKTELNVLDIAARKSYLGIDAFWDAATPKQEASLMTVLAWLVANGIDPAHICGHDECALPLGRKSDPGGTLSVPMESIRKDLIANLTKH